jgi:hypothetical protein
MASVRLSKRELTTPVIGQPQSGRVPKRSVMIMPIKTTAKHNMVIVKLLINQGNSAWLDRAMGYFDRLVTVKT